MRVVRMWSDRRAITVSSLQALQARSGNSLHDVEGALEWYHHASVRENERIDGLVDRDQDTRQPAGK